MERERIDRATDTTAGTLRVGGERENVNGYVVSGSEKHVAENRCQDDE